MKKYGSSSFKSHLQNKKDAVITSVAHKDPLMNAASNYFGPDAKPGNRREEKGIKIRVGAPE